MPDRPAPSDCPPVVAEVVRNGFVESRHRGTVVSVGSGGDVDWALGDPYAPVFPRSANKPLQAVAMVRAGLDLEDELLALAAGSHSGEPFHLLGALQILRGVALDERDLQCPPDWPVDDGARLDLVRAGGERSRLAMNCSGKHAAMLATCVGNGWPTASYRDPAHPLQVGIRAVVEELAGETAPVVGIDGCGAPLLGLSLAGLARAFGRMAAAEPATAEGRVAAAIRSFPEWTSGTTRDEARLIRGVPGLVAKAGAECVYAVGLADGRGVALKVEDGSARPRPVVMAAALRLCGLDEPVLEEIGFLPVLGHLDVVGEVRATLG